MRSIDSLKKRLTKGNLLSIQNESGYLAEAGFEWNKPADDFEINKFESLHSIKLPKGFKKFLKISNGAVLFKDTVYGQWGCNILGLNELIKITNQAKDRGYNIHNKWIVFANWIGDGDMLVFDLKNYASGEKNYIIDGDQDDQTDDWEYIKGGFEEWIDRLIVAQGAKYWRWY